MAGAQAAKQPLPVKSAQPSPQPIPAKPANPPAKPAQGPLPDGNYFIHCSANKKLVWDVSGGLNDDGNDLLIYTKYGETYQ